jgi:hypothetical protein
MQEVCKKIHFMNQIELSDRQSEAFGKSAISMSFLDTVGGISAAWFLSRLDDFTQSERSDVFPTLVQQWSKYYELN